MHAIHNLSIRLRLLMSYALPVAALLLIAILAIQGLSSTQKGVESIYKDRVIPLEQLKVISDNYAVRIVDAVNKANAGIVTGDQVLSDIGKARQEIERQWQAFLSTHHTPEEARLAEEAKALFGNANQALDALESYLAPTSMRGNVQGLLYEFDGPLYESIDPISDKIAELSQLQLSVAEHEYERITNLYELDLKVFLTVCTLAVLGTLVLGSVIYKSIKSPLDRMGATMKKVATESDLSVFCELPGKNELVDMAYSFNNMLSQMRALVVQINDATTQLAAASEELSAVSAESNGTIQRQTEEIEMVVTAMNEMLATAQEIASNAGTADTEARNAEARARAGNQVVSNAVNATFSLIESLNQVAERIRTLEADSTNIGSVLGVITGIAEQTNLLALNAAIEAARAGEQGRGFAVVADEVRTLAQRTQTSTAEIEEAIRRLQSGTHNAVAAMETSREQAEKTGEHATEAGKTLQQITEAVSLITDMNTQIASASEEQTQVSEDINRSLVLINDAARESSTGARQVTQASTELSDLAQQLHSLVATFKTA
ncbi:methyl-accepting chemotaxis protein [Gilvimarinus algae]|uniref:Methyl-accepting chemotaxis protein n=1 Tax=Gilvimarinus algae TaxID=3058037 RepID=A0ABT8TC26_9GAMM|nr:methyl-accepting chemotaxis protein [Gilvimarinus sp. SDUM040014]MDO3381144.1 methyl-accepting chemotaxis protein [Gilvimarinus sp. SDUM040014]